VPTDGKSAREHDQAAFESGDMWPVAKITPWRCFLSRAHSLKAITQPRGRPQGAINTPHFALAGDAFEVRSETFAPILYLKPLERSSSPAPIDGHATSLSVASRTDSR
jgi:hypothetical protein